jgi:TPR repeat protein
MSTGLLCSFFYCFALACCFVFSLYTAYDGGQSLGIRALDLSTFGDPESAEYRIQVLYKQGLAYKTSKSEKALNYFAVAARLGHRPSCYELSMLMRTKGEYAQVIYWLLQAARAYVSPQPQQSLLAWHLPALCCIEEIYEGRYGEELYRALISAEYQGDYYTQLFTRACTCYAEKKYTQAYEIFAFLGSYGHPLALYMLGVCSDTGNGSERNKKRAYAYYKQAAAYGYTHAQQACAWRDRIYKQDEYITQVMQYIEQCGVLSKELTDEGKKSIDILLSQLIGQGTLEDNERCARLLERKNKNMCLLLERYAQSSAYAAYICGLMYKDKNTEKADEYLKRAAKKDIVRASFMLGNYYQKVNTMQAFDYYVSCVLADTNAKEEYEQQLVRTAYKILQESADQQDHYARICLALCYVASNDPQTRTKGLLLSERIFAQACTNSTLVKFIASSPLPLTLAMCADSDPRFEYLQALLYLQVPGFIDKNRGIQCLKSAASHGLPEAQVMLSSYCTCGTDGVEKDLAEAFSLLLKAHEQGFYLATFYLACAYKDNILVPQDLQKARELLYSPCLDTYILALCYRVIDHLEQPVYTLEAVQTLLDALEEHAQMGNKDACLTLGMVYYGAKDSWGKDKLARAFGYLEKAATQGYIRAYRIMGRMLYFAEGIAGNRAYGEELLCKARLLGDQEALCDLADMFYDKKDYRQAFLYYQDGYKETHSADAAAGIALCYVNGHGVEQDIRQAVNYLCFALKNGVSSSAEFKSKYVEQVLPLVLAAVLELVRHNEITGRPMLELLARVLQSVGLTWKEISHTIVVYPYGHDDIAQQIIHNNQEQRPS